MSRENFCPSCHTEFPSSLEAAEHPCPVKTATGYQSAKILLRDAEETLRNAGNRLQNLHAILGREMISKADEIAKALGRL